MNNLPRLLKPLCCVALVVSYLLPTHVFSAAATTPTQTSNQTPNQNTRPIEEIVVHAQKRAQALQDVPVSVTVLDGDLLDRRAAVGLQQVGYWQPNVRLSPQVTAAHLANFYIRGMGLNGSVVSDEPAVGVFVDDVYLGTSAGVMTDFVDLASIEVMRGPQGTLYGHSTTAGVVSLHSQPPVFKPTFIAEIKAGNHNLRSFSATMSRALDNADRWAGRLSVLASDQHGSFRNISHTHGYSGADIGAADLTLVKPSLRWQPSQHSQAILRLEDGRSTNTVGPRHAFIHDLDDVVEQLYAGHPGIPPPAEDELSLNYTPRVDSNWQHAILTFSHKLPSGSLKSTSAYRDYDQEIAADVDGSPFRVFEILDDTRVGQRQISQELVYNLDSSRWATTAGAYFFKQNIHYQEHRLTQPDIGRYLEQWSSSHLQHTSWSLYAYTDVDLTSRLTAGAGIRYNQEHKDADFSPRSALSPSPCPNGFNSCVPAFSDSHIWRNWVPRAMLQWFVNDNANFYTSVSRGFRSGGYNIRAVLPAPVGPYNAENVTAYEIGYKSKWTQQGISINVAGFHNRYDNLQKTVLDAVGNQAILNAAAATIQGLEIEAEWRPRPYLTLHASLGRMWAAYESFDGLDIDGDGIADPQQAKDLRLADVPDWTANLQAVFEKHFGNIKFDAHIDYAFTSSFMTNEVNTIGVRAHRLFNISVGFNWQPHWQLRLYARNLLDEVYYHSALNTACCNVGDRGLPRQWGAGLRYTL